VQIGPPGRQLPASSSPARLTGGKPRNLPVIAENGNQCPSAQPVTSTPPGKGEASRRDGCGFPRLNLKTLNTKDDLRHCKKRSLSDKPENSRQKTTETQKTADKKQLTKNN
jgi:hypothetical protein